MKFEDRKRKNFIGIAQSKFWINTTPDQAGKPHVASRVMTKGPKEGQTVYGLTYDTAHGRLTGIEVKQGEYGKELLLEFDEDTIIQVAFKSGYAEHFMTVLPNIDLERDVYLTTYKFPKKENPTKFQIGWNITQKGKAVLPAAVGRQKDGSYGYFDKDTKALVGGDLPHMPDKRMVDVLGDGVMVLVAKERLDWLETNHLIPIQAVLEAEKANRIRSANEMSARDAGMSGPPDEDSGIPHGDDEEIPF